MFLIFVNLTYTNTLLLSNAALSLGCAKNSLESHHGNSIYCSFILAWPCITIQIKEFRNIWKLVHFKLMN